MGTYISSTERFRPPKICGFSFNSRSCNFWVQSINIPLLMTSLVEFTPYKIALTLKANHALYDVQLYSYHNLQSSRSCLYPLLTLGMISIWVQSSFNWHITRDVMQIQVSSYHMLLQMVAYEIINAQRLRCTDRFTDQADQVRISSYPMCTALSSRTTIDLEITTVKFCFGFASRLL